MRMGQALDRLPERLLGSGKFLKRQEAVQRTVIESAGDFRQSQQRFYFGPESKEPAPCIPGVVKRLFAKPVARRKQLQLSLIPNSKGEHPIEAAETIRAPLLICFENDFRVAVRVEKVALGLQLLHQLDVVVDFAVVTNQ